MNCPTQKLSKPEATFSVRQESDLTVRMKMSKIEAEKEIIA